MSSATVTLISNENTEFTLKKEVAQMSRLIKDVTEMVEEENARIPLPNVDNECLEKIVEYMNHRHGNPSREIEKPIVDRFENVVDEWDNRFLSMPTALLIKLAVATDYMFYDNLRDLCCAKIAYEMHKKSVPEIREMFGVVNDFTEQEENQIREQNRWVEDMRYN